MALYMLHTDIATGLIQGGSSALDRRVARATPRELCISAVTRGELLCGLSRQMLRKKKGRESKPETPPRKEIVEETGDAPVGSGNDSDLDAVIVAQPLVSPIDQTMGSLRKTTHTELAALTPHEAKVLRMRFGIDIGTEHTLENVQRQFDVTRERIRLTEQAALLSRVLDQFLTRIPCLPWDAEAATHFARIAVDLHRSGSPIGSMDTMIAGHAIAVGAVLVTSNERHFARVTGLKIENWTRS
jgi:predicted nucleic acid-binding protein